MTPKRKVIVLGLDCCDPKLIFQYWKNKFPNLSEFIASGISGPIRSTIPCITIPAWSCMLSGQDPGELGIYGFKNRMKADYDSFTIPDSRFVKGQRIWEILGEEGFKSIVVGVPQTYPVQPINGSLVSCMLTPDVTCDFTYPAFLKEEINNWIKPFTYCFDIDNFRNLPKDELFRQIFDMTAAQLLVFKNLVEQKNWDFAISVLIGTDRINHGFWDCIDPDHPDYIVGNEYEQKILDYYQMIDCKIGELKKIAGRDTVFIIVSDHGAKRMQGGVCINQWLINNDYLKLKGDEPGIRPFNPVGVDWSKTKAWGEGGYYGRIWINLNGREKNGIVSQNDYPDLVKHIIDEIESMKGPNNQLLNNQCFLPQQIYRKVNSVAPDIMVYFGDLSWRSIGSVGHSSVFSSTNDTGRDLANHSQHGIFILYDTNESIFGHLAANSSILGIKDTIMKLIKSDDFPIENQTCCLFQHPGNKFSD